MDRGILYKKWAEEIKARDKKCVFCGAIEDLQAHHLYKWEEFKEHRYDLENGLTVCRSCHLKIHTAGGRYGKRRI